MCFTDEKTEDVGTQTRYQEQSGCSLGRSTNAIHALEFFLQCRDLWVVAWAGLVLLECMHQWDGPAVCAACSPWISGGVPCPQGAVPVVGHQHPNGLVGCCYRGGGEDGCGGWAVAVLHVGGGGQGTHPTQAPTQSPLPHPHTILPTHTVAACWSSRSTGQA